VFVLKVESFDAFEFIQYNEQLQINGSENHKAHMEKKIYGGTVVI
jgi:hypothetical protein